MCLCVCVCVCVCSTPTTDHLILISSQQFKHFSLDCIQSFWMQSIQYYCAAYLNPNDKALRNEKHIGQNTTALFKGKLQLTMLINSKILKMSWNFVYFKFKLQKMDWLAYTFSWPNEGSTLQCWRQSGGDKRRRRPVRQPLVCIQIDLCCFIYGVSHWDRVTD